jgi:hypothetical protein
VEFAVSAVALAPATDSIFKPLELEIGQVNHAEDDTTHLRLLGVKF